MTKVWCVVDLPSGNGMKAKGDKPRRHKGLMNRRAIGHGYISCDSGTDQYLRLERSGSERLDARDCPCFP